MWNILDMYGLPEKFIRIIKKSYDGFSCCVRTTEGISPWFNVTIELVRDASGQLCYLILSSTGSRKRPICYNPRNGALNVRRDISLSVDLLMEQLPSLAMKIEESTIFY